MKRRQDLEALAATVKALLADPAECQRLGRNARAEFEAKYTAERNYEQLMNTYRQAQERFQGSSNPAHRGQGSSHEA